MNCHLALLSLVFAFSSLPASAILDTNENGLSDLWEAQYKVGEHLTANLDPAVDDDGDGWTNALEAIAGTDPFDPTPPYGVLSQAISHVHPVYNYPVVTDPEPIEDPDPLNYIPPPVDPNLPAPELVTQGSVSISWPTIPGKRYTLLYSLDQCDGSWSIFEEPFIGDGSIELFSFELNVSVIKFWRVKVEDVDTDGDGLTNAEEASLGTSPWLQDTDSDGVRDIDELAEASTNPLLASDMDYDGIPDDLEKHLAMQLLALHPTAEYWGVAVHTALMDWDLDPDYDYTGDQISAAQLSGVLIEAATNVSMAPYNAALSGGVQIQLQSRRNNCSVTNSPGSNGTPASYYGIYNYTIPGNWDGASIFGFGSVTDEYLSSRIDSLQWGSSTVPALVPYSDDHWELGWLAAETEFFTESFDDGQSQSHSQGHIYQNRFRLLATRIDHDPVVVEFLKITTTVPHTINWAIPANMVLEHFFVELPRGRMVDPWSEFEAVMVPEEKTTITLVPISFNIHKQNEQQPADGVLVKVGDTVVYQVPGLGPLVTSGTLAASDINWEWRKLRGDGTFCPWTEFSSGNGPTVQVVESGAGIFQIRVRIDRPNGSCYFSYHRKADDPHGKDSNGIMNPIYNAGQPDYVGIAAGESQLQIAQKARAFKGSTAYALQATIAVTPTITATQNDNKCNVFIYHITTMSGASVPLDAGGWPPRAYDWYDSGKAIAGWAWRSDSEWAEPGTIVARYIDGDSFADYLDWGFRWPSSSAHCGILDYDGAWVNAGAKNVNRYPHLTTSSYQTAYTRKN